MRAGDRSGGAEDPCQQLRSMASRLFLAQEREKQLMAEEVHDSVCQTLVMCNIKLGMLVKSAPTAGTAESLQELQQLISQLASELRLFLFRLKPPQLRDFGLEAALKDLLRRLAGSHKIRVSFEDDGEPKPMLEETRTVLFRAVSELIINLVKHAHAQTLKVTTAKVGDEIHIAVQSDGAGCDETTMGLLMAGKGLGLFDIQERPRDRHETVHISSATGHNTHFVIKAPLCLPEGYENREGALIR